MSRVTYYLYSLKFLLLFLCKNFLTRFQVSRSLNFRVGVLYSYSTFIQSESCIWCSDWMFFHIHPIRKLYMMFWLDVFSHSSNQKAVYDVLSNQKAVYDVLIGCFFTFIQLESCIWCSDWMFFHIHPIESCTWYMMFWLDVFWVRVQNSYSKVLWLWGEVLAKRINH